MPRTKKLIGLRLMRIYNSYPPFIGWLNRLDNGQEAVSATDLCVITKGSMPAPGPDERHIVDMWGPLDQNVVDEMADVLAEALKVPVDRLAVPQLGGKSYA